MTTPTPKIAQKWWYLLPTFLGSIGGIITWFTLKSFDKKLAKNCLILGIFLDVFKIMILVGLAATSDTFNLITKFDNISETSNFDIHFNINPP